MSTYQYFAKLSLLLVLFVLISFTGVFQSPAHSISNPISFFKADAADSKGDKAYDNQNYTEAFAAYQQAADAGSAYGQFMLANMYLAGEGVNQNYGKYMYWMRQAGSKGYPAANYLLGMAYLLSDPSVATEYFKKAAGDEHGAAMHMLGLMYARGTGVQKSIQEALNWFRLAKAQGIPVKEQLLSQSGIETSLKKKKVSTNSAQFIKEIQQRLTDLGYTPGPIDGLYGKRTRAEIKTFQQKKGMKVDGLATDQLLRALRRSSH